jgi:hypothetical protein
VEERREETIRNRLRSRMNKVPLCTPAWWEDPMVLISDSWLAQWKRRSTPHVPCFSERVNALTRTGIAVLIVALLFSLFNHDIITTVSYSVILGLIITLPDIIDMIKAPYIQEQFVARITPDEPSKLSWKTPPVGGSDDTYDDGELMTLPSPRNPFMNVLIDEIKYNPLRPEAKSVEDPVVKSTMDDYFRVNWFSDPTDVFGKSQNQRQFVTMPSTTVPNDRKSFQDWLYKIPGKTCKEGGREACVGGTGGSSVPWLN